MVSEQGSELKSRVVNALSNKDLETAMQTLSDINTALGLGETGHFQPTEYVRDMFRQELREFCDGRSSNATIYMGDGGHSRLWIGKRRISGPFELELHLVPSETTIDRWQDLNIGRVFRSY